MIDILDDRFRQYGYYQEIYKLNDEEVLKKDSDATESECEKYCGVYLSKALYCDGRHILSA